MKEETLIALRGAKFVDDYQAAEVEFGTVWENGTPEAQAAFKDVCAEFGPCAGLSLTGAQIVTMRVERIHPVFDLIARMKS